MKTIVKQIFQWGIALVISALIMNTVLFFYNSRPGWIDRKKGSTTAVYTPNTGILKLTEGKGYHKSDSRGYVNDVDKLADNYVIAVGASHTQGKEVGRGERYTDLLNEWLGYTDEAYVYNVSEDGYFLPYILKGFEAVTKEFPDSSKIILEISTTYFSPDLFRDSLEQREFDENLVGQNILNTLSFKKKLNIYVKQYSPLLYNINNQINSIKKIQNAKKAGGEKEEIDLDEYKSLLEQNFELITSIYDKEIIIMYHPDVELNESGEMTVKTAQTDEIFFDACKKYNITVVDLTDKFLEEYKNGYKVPCGFSNTAMAEGHLNKEGHRMIAEELLKVLK